MKLSRRSFCACALGAPLIAQPAFAQAMACDVMTPERQALKTPDEAIQRLKEGNLRFVQGHTVNCDLMAQAHQTATYQSPAAAIVGCIDSRVPPEMVFDQRIGDVFCARIAGNFVNTDIIGSLEFATKVSGARAIVVLGHSSCGAIKGAIDHVELGNLTATLANIEPAVAAARADGARDSKNTAFVQAVAETNARMAAEALTARSPILKDLVASRQLRIAAAMHDITTGRVTFLS